MPDHLGSTSLVTDSSGNAIENTSYAPFGEILSGGDASRYQYEGKEFDSTTGQYDFHFRGYKSEWGKFTQPDSLLPNVYDPQQLNRYAFERNNPFRYTDEKGHRIQEFFLNIPQSFYNFYKGTSLSFKYAGLGNRALRHGEFKSAVRNYGKSAETGVETFFNSLTIFGAGAKLTYEPSTVSIKDAVNPFSKWSDVKAIIDKYFEENEEEYEKEKKKLDLKMLNKNINNNANQQANTNQIGQGTSKISGGGGSGGGGGGRTPHPDSAGRGYAQPIDTPEGRKWVPW